MSETLGKFKLNCTKCVVGPADKETDFPREAVFYSVDFLKSTGLALDHIPESMSSS